MTKITLDENAKEDWLKLVKKHKNKQKGLPSSSTLNTNSGDVETHINMFNKMNTHVETPSNNPVSGPFGDSVISSSTSDIGGGLSESLDLFEALEVATPYMLRNDGKVFTCGEFHPYIKPIMSSDNRSSIRSLLERNRSKLKWFYNHTQDNDTKLNIIVVLNSVIDNAAHYNLDKEELQNFRTEFSSTDNSVVTIFDLESLYELLNQKTNQEFCRFRTSNVYSGGSEKNIYFRISSHGVNWFDLIWNFVFNNKDWIKSITITGDPQSGKTESFYKHNDVIINHLPICEFINLNGKPVFEKLDLQHGVQLHHAYELGNPYYWVQENNSKYNEFFDENFVKESTMDKDIIELYYSKLELDDVPTGKVFRGTYYEPDQYETTDVTIDYTYKVSKKDVIEFLQDLPKVQEIYCTQDVSDEEFGNIIQEKFDDLFDEYETEILEYFRNSAADEAREDFDYEYYFGESLKNNTIKEQLDDDFDLSMRTLL